MSDDALLRDVLGWVNRVRAEYNIGDGPLAALPPGSPQSCTSCPIAQALDGLANVMRPSSYLLVTGDVIRHPDYVTEFIDRFDAGAFPELNEER